MSSPGSTAMPRMLELLAARVSGLLDLASISRDLGTPHTTLRRYFAPLEATFLVSLILDDRPAHGVEAVPRPSLSRKCLPTPGIP